jgi:opacity protein-like surface antigen
MQFSAAARRLIVSAMAVVWTIGAASAAAQASDTRHVSVGGGAGIATPLHGDFDFRAASWQADVRVDTTPHFGFSVFLEEWRHTDEDVFTNQTMSGPSGVLGRVDRVTTRTRHVTRVAGWSLLGRGTGGRVTFSGGGGVSYLLYSRDFSQTPTGCVPANVCRDSSLEFDNNSFAAQVQAGADIDVTRHIAVMGQFRLIVPLEDPGSGHHTIIGGVRYVF